MADWEQIKTAFKNRFPDFDTATVDKYLPLLENAWKFYFCAGYDGNEEVVLNLLAHLLVHESNPGSATIQGVASKSAGGLSASYHGRGNNSPDADFFYSTKYGQRYLQLLRTRSGGIHFV